MPITTSTGSCVWLTAFQSPPPTLMNMEISTYIPSVSPGSFFRYSSIPFSIALLSCSDTLPEMSFTSIRISMVSPSATLCICSGVSTAFAAAMVSATSAVYPCSSQTTVTMTVPSPSLSAELVSAMPFPLPSAVDPPGVIPLPLSATAGVVCTSSFSGCCPSGVPEGSFTVCPSSGISGVAFTLSSDGLTDCLGKSSLPDGFGDSDGLGSSDGFGCSDAPGCSDDPGCSDAPGCSGISVGSGSGVSDGSVGFSTVPPPVFMRMISFFSD